MCLTIPAQVIKLKEGRATIQDFNTRKEINTVLIPDLKVGDWLLYISNKAIKKIPKDEAKEIIELLKISQPLNILKLDRKYRKIIEKSKTGDLIKEEIIDLLNVQGREKEALYSEANITRKTYLKDFICLHGIIEFSNFCKNDCFYCGLRRENQELKRYRMEIPEIVKVAEKAVNERGYKLLVLQSGEDYFYTDEMLVEMIRKIKERCRVFIFMSIGERGYESYQKMKQAGASGVLFRFETSNPKLFKRLHPQGKNFQNRFEHLKFMKELGYFIATGSLIGLPGQTIEDLADDILTMKKWANMISMGPFIPTENTPLAEAPNDEGTKQWKIEMNLKMIAILRLMMPEVRIPVVTALETLAGQEGRKKALQAGANSLMFNLTPEKCRPFYRTYPDKFYQKESIWEKHGLFKYEESYKMLEERMQKELKKNNIYAKY
jgi:biotin synthase